MTETKPATDEEINNAEISATYYGQGNMAFPAPLVIALCRRIDAERERADKAEADCEAWLKNYDERGKLLNAIRTERDALAAQLAEAQQQIAALREARVEWRVQVGSGHEGTYIFDNEDAAISYYCKEVAIPSYCGPGRRRHGSIIKVTTMVEDISKVALAQTEGAEQ